MDCKRTQVKAVKIDEKCVKEQEHRKLTREWQKVVRKYSSATVAVEDPEDESKKGVRFRSESPHSRCTLDDEEEGQQEPQLSPLALKRKMAKMKSFAKRKSPLQKFDEIVTRELLNRQYAEEDSVCPFEGSQKWPADFTCGKVTPSGKKLSFDTKLSKTLVYSAEKELKEQDKDPSDARNAELMDAIDKLIQAQASYRFDEAVKAAEAGASSVPLELAEEVAITCAKDYQSQIIDFVTEKTGANEGRRPMEIIGYIGITKKKNTADDD